MARHYIGFSPNKGATVFRNVTKDETGRPLVLLEEGEQSRLVLDFQSYVEASETISSAVVSNNNITVTVANNTNSVTLTMSGADSWGETTVTVTFSTGDIYSEKIRIRNKRRYIVPQTTKDYGQLHP